MFAQYEPPEMVTKKLDPEEQQRLDEMKAKLKEAWGKGPEEELDGKY